MMRLFKENSLPPNSLMMAVIWTHFKLSHFCFIGLSIFIAIYCNAPVRGAGDSGDTAGLKCQYLTSDESWQCRGCARILISRKNRIPFGGHMGKPTICMCENKGTDQLRSNCEADQRLCFRYSDNTVPLLLKSEISSF